MTSRYSKKLPNDYARCSGNFDKKCLNCMRRITIDNDDKRGWYSYIEPTAQNNECDNHIAQRIPKLPKHGLFA